MLTEGDLFYFKTRERSEREAASAALCSASRDAHFRLAEHYADRVWALEEQGRILNPRLRSE
jgi:hypothetical protein